MRLEQKLNLWVKNNLIEPSQKQQIMDFEQNRGTPLFFGGMVLLGIFAITLGVISLIAANWEFIPGWVKIFFDIVLLSLIAGGSYYAWSKNHFIWFEAGVFALFMMVGASIGLIGQVFQTNGSFACAGLFWGIITAPLLAISKRRSLPFCWLILFFSSLLNIPAVEELIWHLFNWWFWADHPEVALIAILVHTGIIAACLSMADHLSDYKYPIFSEARWIVYFAMYSSLLFYMVFAAFESKAIYSLTSFSSAASFWVLWRELVISFIARGR